MRAKVNGCFLKENTFEPSIFLITKRIGLYKLSKTEGGGASIELRGALDASNSWQTVWQ